MVLGRCARHDPRAPLPQTREARRGKTRRRHFLLNVVALGPRLVLASVVGSAFCPLTPSRRLHCLLQRHSRPMTPQRPRSRKAGESRLLKRTMRATRITAQPETHRKAETRVAVRRTDSSTVGDTSPRDAFPAASSLVAEASVARWLEGHDGCAPIDQPPPSAPPSRGSPSRSPAPIRRRPPSSR